MSQHPSAHPCHHKSPYCLYQQPVSTDPAGPSSKVSSRESLSHLLGQSATPAPLQSPSQGYSQVCHSLPRTSVLCRPQGWLLSPWASAQTSPPDHTTSNKLPVSLVNSRVSTRGLCPPCSPDLCLRSAHHRHGPGMGQACHNSPVKEGMITQANRSSDTDLGSLGKTTCPPQHRTEGHMLCLVNEGGKGPDPLSACVAIPRGTEVRCRGSLGSVCLHKVI